VTWILTDTGKRCEPIPGVPWRDMSDVEFAEAETEMDARFPEQLGSLRRSPFFEYVADAVKAKAKE